MADMTRSEQLLNAIATGEPSGCAAMTRREKFLAYLAGECDAPPSKAYTREEKLLAKICENGPGGGGGGGETTEPGKPYIDTSKMTSFSQFFAENYNLHLIDYIDTRNAKNLHAMFSISNIASIPPLDTGNAEIFTYMFQSCSGIRTIPPLDTKNGTKFSRFMYGCRNLETVTITTAKGNLSTDSFQGCTALKNITIGEGWAVNIYLHYSNELTVESLHGMIENLADLTGKTAKTFQIGATNLAKIDEAHLAMLDAKNWEYS